MEEWKQKSMMEIEINRLNFIFSAFNRINMDTHTV